MALRKKTKKELLMAAQQSFGNWHDEAHVYPRPPRSIVPPVPDFGPRDLFPGPGAGMYPTRGDFGGGSMLVGPNDPRFFGGRVREPGLPGGLQGVPPGARFDPYGPPGVPGFEPGRFARNPPRPGGGTNPDLQHFPDGSIIFMHEFAK